MKDGKDKKYRSERRKVKFREEEEDARWYGSCRTRNAVNLGRGKGW